MTQSRMRTNIRVTSCEIERFVLCGRIQKQSLRPICFWTKKTQSGDLNLQTKHAEPRDAAAAEPITVLEQSYDSMPGLRALLLVVLLSVVEALLPTGLPAHAGSRVPKTFYEPHPLRYIHIFGKLPPSYSQR